LHIIIEYFILVLIFVTLQKDYVNGVRICKDISEFLKNHSIL